jgi:hypothetical protein
LFNNQSLLPLKPTLLTSNLIPLVFLPTHLHAELTLITPSLLLAMVLIQPMVDTTSLETHGTHGGETKVTYSLAKLTTQVFAPSTPTFGLHPQTDHPNF